MTPVRTFSVSRLMLPAVLLILGLITVYGFATIDTGGVDLYATSLQTLSYFGTMFGSPAATPTHFSLSPDAGQLELLWAGIKLVLITLSLAFITTLIGGVVSLVLALFAARNLSNPHLGNLIKGFVAVIRAVPTVLWVLIFAIGAGLGSVAAIIGMSFHTVGYLLKAYSESFEELDKGSIEALRASGANWFHIVFQVILPSSFGYILSWTFIRFEINFAVAVAMGAAAGAGGLGYQLQMASVYFYDIQEIGYITYLILGVALIMEVVATRLKKKHYLQE